LLVPRDSVDAGEDAEGIGAERPWRTGIIGVAEEMKVQLPTGGLRVTQSDISRLVPVIVVGNDTARIESREIVGPAKASSEPAAPRGQAPRGEAAALGQGAETWPGFAT